MLGTKGIIVSLGRREVKGILFSSLLGRTKVESLESSESIEGLLGAFPANVAITLLLPGHLFMARKVALPFASPRIIRKTLPFEMEGMIPFPVDEVLVDSVPAGRTDKGSSVIALAIPHKTIAECVRLFPEGRMPERIIPDFIALFALGKRIRPEQEMYGVLNIERESSSLVVIAGGAPLTMRSIKIDGDKTSIAEWVEATVRPLQQEGQEIGTLYVNGEMARQIAPLLERIAEVVPLPETVNGVSDEEWAVWSTLAGGAVSARELPPFNILGLHPEHERWARTLRTLSVGTGILLIVGTTDLYVRYTSAAQTVAAVRAEAKDVFVSVMPQVKRVVKEDTQMKVALITEKATREALIGKSFPSFLAVSKGIERLVREHPQVKVREAGLESGRVTIVGEGSGIGAEGLKKLFSEIDGAQDAQVEEIVQGVDPNSYRFRVRAQVK